VRCARAAASFVNLIELVHGGRTHVSIKRREETDVCVDMVVV
jgi:hypothetical protein